MLQPRTCGFGVSQALAQFGAPGQSTCRGECGTEGPCCLQGVQWERTGPAHHQHWADVQVRLGKEEICGGWMHTGTCYTSLIYTSSATHKGRKWALQPLWRWVRVLPYATHIPSLAVFFLFHPWSSYTYSDTCMPTLGGWSSLLQLLFLQKTQYSSMSGRWQAFNALCSCASTHRIS